MDSVYCYPGTNILINKLGEQTQLFNEYEKELSSARYYELQKTPIKGLFDTKHLCSIHEYLFQDMYEWAGKFRTVDIAKNDLFCLSHLLASYMTDICSRLAKDNYLIGIPRVQHIAKMADYYGDINAAHPFREGNGRSLRVFTEMLGKVSGLEINFDLATEQELLQASVQSFSHSNKGLVDIFQKVSSPISKTEQIKNCKAILPTSLANKMVTKIKNLDISR